MAIVWRRANVDFVVQTSKFSFYLVIAFGLHGKWTWQLIILVVSRAIGKVCNLENFTHAKVLTRKHGPEGLCVK